MALVLNEERFIEQSVALLDERINSPVARFIEQTPTFVIYYHINVDESTSDEGFKNVDSVIGNNSPIKYQRIDKFPIYGLDAVVAQLQDTEVGLDVSYEGEATILPNTIKPLPNDYFIIPYVGGEVLFRLTEIGYDNIRPDNFYKIMFKLDAIDEDKKRVSLSIKALLEPPVVEEVAEATEEAPAEEVVAEEAVEAPVEE